MLQLCKKPMITRRGYQLALLGLALVLLRPSFVQAQSNDPQGQPPAAAQKSVTPPAASPDTSEAAKPVPAAPKAEGPVVKNAALPNQPPNAQRDFLTGVQSFQQKQFDKAGLSFQRSLQAEPNNPRTLYNYGLVQLKLSQPGLAIGALRKAVTLDPDFTAAKKALQQALAKVPAHPFADQDSNWEAYRALVLSRVSLNQLLVLTWLFFMLGGWLLIRYWGRRRRALRDQTPSPKPPTFGIICALLAVLALAITVTKGFDALSPRATIIAPKVQLRSGPSTQDASLLELYQGFEVIIDRTTKDWAQVTYPGGLTGWVPKNQIFITSERKTW